MASRVGAREPIHFHIWRFSKRYGSEPQLRRSTDASRSYPLLEARGERCRSAGVAPP
ncbi:hypothetical protein [Haloarchaeobius sp. TZWSO28]|uniref:hypothetical protein n=1 Tax=Haloarchaeobius sp. TZWSO28 TaxID=3446119 RepID=UPI003EB75254